MLEDLPNDDEENDYFNAMGMVDRNNNVEIFQGEKLSSIATEEMKVNREENE